MVAPSCMESILFLMTIVDDCATATLIVFSVLLSVAFVVDAVVVGVVSAKTCIP